MWSQWKRASLTDRPEPVWGKFYFFVRLTVQEEILTAVENAMAFFYSK
jgi:hypothetical protein